MKYKPTIWLFMTSRLKKGLPTCWPREDVKKLLVKAKPIYKDILSRMKGISDNNPMASNITMSMMHSRLIRKHTVAEGAGICDYWTVSNKIADPQ